MVDEAARDEGASVGSPGPNALAMRSFAFERLSAIAAVLDGSGTIIDTNEAWRLFAQLNDGTFAATGPGVNYLEVCDRAAAAGSTEAAAVAAGMREILTGNSDRFDFEYPCPSPSQDRWFLAQASAAPVADGRGAVLFHVDITSRKALEARLSAEADHDELTGLLNRRAATRALEQLIAAGPSTLGELCVLSVDLDGFKKVNDTFGHHVGDELLAQVSARAQRTIREGDLLCRVGGDEFVLICPGMKPEQAAGIAARLRQVIAEPFQVGAVEVHVGASVGYVTADIDATVQGLLAAADGEMYHDKRASRT